MGGEIDLERRFAAEEAYITGQVTLAALARQSGISETQLERWSAEEGWREKRREYRAAFADIKRNSVELRRRFIEKALKSLNPMDAFAIASLEKIALAAEKGAAGAPPAAEMPAGEAPAIRTAAEAAAALKGIVEARLARMLAQPGTVNLAAVKDVKQCLELLEKMQGAAEAAPEADRVLSEQAIRDIREQLKL